MRSIPRVPSEVYDITDRFVARRSEVVRGRTRFVGYEGGPPGGGATGAADVTSHSFDPIEADEIVLRRADAGKSYARRRRSPC